jgi:hypothetical protein
MHSPWLNKIQFVAIVTAFAALVAPATAATVATFADPSDEGLPPLFIQSGNTLSAGWSLPGLTLITPINHASYPNATFTMTNLAITDLLTGATSGGRIQFFDSLAQLILQIDFGAGRLNTPFGFGASDFLGQNVVYSGPIITHPVSGENFAFSFTNPTPIADGFTYTASFTSSAVPEPSSVALLALGVCGLLRKR